MPRTKRSLAAAVCCGLCLLLLSCSGYLQPPPAYTTASLTAQVVGARVTTAMTVAASRQVAAQDFGICVRSPSGERSSFATRAVTLTVAGTSYDSDTLSFAPGTYTYYPCFYTADHEAQVVLESKSFTVGSGQGVESTRASQSPRRKPTTASPAPDTGAPGSAGTADHPNGLKGEWRSIFADEFTGDTLNLRKWRPNWLAGSDSAITKPVNRSELSCYDPANVTVGGGSARLKAEKRRCTDEMGRTYAYASGLIESARKFEFGFGFAEARLFLPGGKENNCGPNWSAFWLQGHRPGQDGEIDVMECLSRNNVAWHYHTAEIDVGANPPGWNNELPRTDGWHTFGVDYQPGSLDFYYDGVLVGTQHQGVRTGRHFLIVNLALSGDEVKEETLKVDYVRVWKRS